LLRGRCDLKNWTNIRSLPAAAMETGAYWLNSTMVEDDFRTHFSESSYATTRPVLMLATVLVLGCMLGALLLGVLSWTMAVFGFVFILPTLGATIFASYRRGWHEIYQVLLAASAFWIGLVCVSVVTRASLAGMSYYLALQIGWLFLVWLTLGLRFRYAATATIMLSLIFVGGTIYWQYPLEEALFAGALLLAVNLIGGYSCYKLEEALRLAYRESRLLSDLAERDGLTRLLNRRSYDHYLERLWRQSRREQAQLTIMLIDIDSFKEYNDQYGHQAGDDALKQVAGVIATHAQRPLDFAGRYGGEEFSLILYGSPGGAVSDRAEQVRAAIAALAIPHEASQVSPHLTVSIGVALLMPGSQRSLNGAIQLADEALYQAKEEGRNRVVIRESRSTHIETGRFRARKDQQASA